MRKALRLVLIILLLTLCVSVKAKAESYVSDYLKDKGVEIEVSSTVDFYNKYVWRGFLLDDDTVFQPGVTINGYGFEGGFWGSWDLDNEDALASDEADGFISYGFDFGFIDERFSIVSMSFGHTWYGFQEVETFSKEYSIGISIDTFLSPYFNFYSDYADEAKGGASGEYYAMGIGHSFTLSEEYGITADLGYELGFNHEAFINGDGGYNLLTASLVIPLTEKISISPTIGYSAPFGDLKDSSDGNQSEQFYSGISLAFNF